MQSLEIKIDGEFWDSHLYDDRLYLFTRQGTVKVYRWDKLINRAGWSRDELPFAMQFLTRGRSWYNSQQQQLLKSPLYRRQVLEIINRLCATPRTISDATLRGCFVGEYASPLFPHNDLEVYYGKIFLGGSDGIVSAGAKEVDSFEQVNDIPCLRLSGSYKTLAVAAGTDGLWQVNLGDRDRAMADPVMLSTWPCLSCSWARFDVVASTSEGNGYVAGFALPDGPGRREVNERTLLNVVSGGEIFDSADRGYLVGAYDQLFFVAHDFIRTEAWNPYRRSEMNKWDFFAAGSKRSSYDFAGPDAEVIDAVATSFGLVLETSRSLFVFASDGTRKRFGEPVSWRAFPRSQRYINHLHIAQENAIRINAYVHDYFLNYRDRTAAAGRPGGDD